MFDDCWLTKECRKQGLNAPWIAKPKNEVHCGNHYAQLPYLGPTNRATEQAKERLVDALEWLSYIYKARDKLDSEWEQQGQIFPSSRPKRSKEVASITGSRPICLGDVAIKIKTGDNLLDAMIGKMQHIYQLASSSGAAPTSSEVAQERLEPPTPPSRRTAATSVRFRPEADGQIPQLSDSRHLDQINAALHTQSGGLLGA